MLTFVAATALATGKQCTSGKGSDSCMVLEHALIGPQETEPAGMLLSCHMRRKAGEAWLPESNSVLFYIRCVIHCQIESSSISGSPGRTW